jgi:uncharacterized Zn finger protein (UPF0148 family)
MGYYNEYGKKCALCGHPASKKNGEDYLCAYCWNNNVEPERPNKQIQTVVATDTKNGKVIRFF